MNETTFENAKIEDKVWDYRFKRWGKIKEIIDCLKHPFKVVFPGFCETFYNKQGYTADDCYKTRVLFWDEVPEPVAPPRPKRKVKKTIEAWVIIYPKGLKYFFYKNEKDARMFFDNKKNKLVKLIGEYEIEE